MTKKKNCNDCGACAHVDGKNAAFANVEGAYQAPSDNEAVDCSYGYYSRVLQKPFDSLNDLQMAEAAYLAEQKAKVDQAAQKKADAQKVEEAFKALNAARKVYKEDLAQLTKEYAEKLEETKNAFELGKKDIHNDLAKAEETYSTALKEFTTAYPEGFHLTLKDSDFETTISGSHATVPANKKVATDIYKLFDLLFNF